MPVSRRWLHCLEGAAAGRLQGNRAKLRRGGVVHQQETAVLVLNRDAAREAF